MRLLRIVAAVAALATLGVAAAHADAAYSTANVNMRTGPDIDFPSIGVIPEGEELFVAGCLRDESWCDVRWGPERGWVYSEYIAFDYRGQMVLLPDYGPAYFRIPFVDFSARDYWGRYYVGRPWYRDRDRWYGFRVRPREGWYAPPRDRRPGWWRGRYVAPPGMRAPPEHWRREMRGGRRDDRRDDRREWRDDRRGDDRRDDRRGDDRRDGGRGDDRRDGRGDDRRDDRRDRR